MKYTFTFVMLLATVTTFCAENSIASVGSEEEFEQIISKASQPVVVQFHSGCPVCNSTRRHLKEIVSEYSEVVFVEIDINVLSDVAEKYNITALPTVLVFEPHAIKPRHAIMGPDSKDMLKSKIDETVASLQKTS